MSDAHFRFDNKPYCKNENRFFESLDTGMDHYYCPHCGEKL